MERALVYFSGTVQGVGMRYFVKDVAIRYKLTGYVKNIRDGRVEALLEGPKEQIKEALAMMRIGPPAARIHEMTVNWLQEQPSKHSTESPQSKPAQHTSFNVTF